MKFDDFQHASVVRSWTKHWDLPRWGNALAGEVGELCNVIKKIDRDGVTPELMLALKHELGDVVAYAALIADKAGYMLEDCVVEKFNIVSDRTGSPIRLPERK